MVNGSDVTCNSKENISSYQNLCFHKVIFYLILLSIFITYKTPTWYISVISQNTGLMDELEAEVLKVYSLRKREFNKFIFSLIVQLIWKSIHGKIWRQQGTELCPTSCYLISYCRITYQILRLSEAIFVFWSKRFPQNMPDWFFVHSD